MDILPTGLDSLKTRSNRLIFNSPVSRMQGDLFKGLPLNDASVSCVTAHFSIYTLPEKKDRSRAYQEFWRVLKPGGLLITSNPTDNYDAAQIIRSSLKQLQDKGKPWVVKKYLVYPMTFHLGLKHIERQIKTGKWHGYKPEELRDEVTHAGFSIEHSESVYGGSGFLVTGRKA
jgi:ubiquinone/menaquinone biosynthesis C-methylase UbiE